MRRRQRDAFYARDASPTKVVLYFRRGGGACWSTETCDPHSSNEYRRSAEGQAPGGEGILALEDERNPLAGHSFVYVPYCTGDVHLGNATTEYTPDRTIQHKGAVNCAAALDYLATTYPDATDVVVVGASAGAVSSPIYAGMESDGLPDAKVTMIADSAGAYADVPELNAIVTGDAWGVERGLPAWFDPGSLTAPGVIVESAQHDPDIVFARHRRQRRADRRGGGGRPQLHRPRRSAHRPHGRRNLLPAGRGGRRAGRLGDAGSRG